MKLTEIHPQQADQMIDSQKVTPNDRFATTLLHQHCTTTKAIKNAMKDIVLHQIILLIGLIMARNMLIMPLSTIENITATRGLVMDTIRALKRIFAPFLMKGI